MIAAFSFLLILVLSLLVVRIATVALTLTGLSKPLARFQARSAFTGAGFTTNETERVVNHPVRRRIIMLLMLLGNAGVVSALASLIVSFIGDDDQQVGFFQSFWFKITILVLGMTVLWFVAHSPVVDRHLNRIIKAALRKYTKLEVRDYAGLLHLSGDYAVSELLVEEGHWCADQTLAELNLTDEGLIVLGIEKHDGGYIGAPRGDSPVVPGDTLIIYGPDGTLEDLDRRRADPDGNWAHVKAVDEQRQRQQEEDRPDS